MNALTRFSTRTIVKSDVMNKMCTEIEARENELEQAVLDRVTSGELTEFAQTLATELANRDTEIGKKVTQTEYDTKMTALDSKNTEQDNAIANKVNNSTFSAAKLALETKDTELAAEIAKKTTTSLNGTSTNVNFIENKVGQDGLICVTKSSEIYDTITSGKLYYYFSFVYNNDSSYKRLMEFSQNATGAIGIQSTLLFCPYIESVFNGNGLNYNGFENNKTYNVELIIDIDNKKYSISLNGNKFEKTVTSFGQSFNKLGVINGTKVASLYNRQLAPSEINHNFKVLNNAPSINKINDYAIATDTDHIEDRTGRTAEQINRVFYKNNCKEITSNGGDIVVNNGMDGYLLSATLQGNTKVFKSPKGTNTWTEIPSTETRDTTTYDYKLESAKAIITNNTTKYSFYSSLEDKLANRVIELTFSEDKVTLNEDGGANWNSTSKKIIIDNVSNFTLRTDRPNHSANTTVTFTSGNIYPIKASSKVVCDKAVGTTSSLLWNTDISGIAVDSQCKVSISVKKEELTTVDLASFIEWFSKKGNMILICEGTNVTITNLDKSLVPTILTQLQNQFTFGEGVAPYSATIQVPCTDDIKKSYDKLVLLNGYTQTVGTATPVVNLLNTGLVRLQMDLTAPSTTPNATLFTLPLELRPITTQRVPVFINGVCVLATIDKTTGNVNLPSIPSANANVYIKTDYRRDI